MENKEEDLESLLVALNEGIGSKAVGLCYSVRGEIQTYCTIPACSGWEDFVGIECLGLPRGGWHRRILIDPVASIDCGCGLHSVRSFLIDQIWILVVLTDGPLISEADAVIANAVTLLAEILRPSPWRKGSSSQPPSNPSGQSGPAELGIPAWWTRRLTDS
ncbi:MAG TPA: hypothetical protein VH853_12180 [Polyangia bacterium]|nr:hypothetical protein [Polyangia bacterium]